MRFEYWKSNGKTYIKAISESENEKFGYRAEGPYPRIEMINNTVEFNYEVKDIHPDILALLCMVCFYPYCKGEVTFPMSVSENFSNAFGEEGLKQKELIDGKYTKTNLILVKNVDINIRPYKGSNISVSYGGGIDSTALYALFPEAIYIHEQSMLPNGRISKDNSINNIDYINKNGGKAISFYNTNRNNISRPSGWSTWTACAANSLLLATEYNIGYIFTGTVLGSLFLSNGKKYTPSHENKNEWVETFKKIGIPLVQVTGGISEISNAKILIESNLINLAVWCNANDGGNCHRCWKCFRRDTILNYLSKDKYSDEYWDRYRNDYIINKLNDRPLYFGHIFKETLKEINHIDWLKSITDDIQDSSEFINNLYEPSLLIIPEELRNYVKNKITKYIEINDSELIKKWSQ